MMKAKRKSIETLTLEDFNIEQAQLVKVLKTTQPTPRQSGIKVETVEELVSTLKKKGLI